MFVTSKEIRELGIGKLISHTKDRATIEFFDSPIGDEYPTREVSVQSIQIRPLAKETRVYCRDSNADAWSFGRVLDGDGDVILVQFPNRNIQNVSAQNVFVRWDKPIVDPTPYLAHFITETPYFASARRKFIHSILTQRAVAEGMSGLLSAAIELESHQIDVIRRVLQDPVQRYLLADEVGLGKTIEAGVLIRQYVLDAPVEHDITIVVPPTLRQQWRNELAKKFMLGDFLDDSVHVVHWDDRQALLQHLSHAKMLVVDEAHHVAAGYGSFDRRQAELYELIRAASRKVERLLLLSATPVIGNERAFLAMLHLLDPKMYALEDEVSFAHKIENRQSIAELVAGFIPENALQLDGFADQLVGLFPQDKILHELIARLRPILDRMPGQEDEELKEAIYSIRAHVTETYRLHRRILRNRRRTVLGLTPKREGTERIRFASAEIAEIALLLEEWRSRALSSLYGSSDEGRSEELRRLFAVLVDAFACDVVMFAKFIQHRLRRKHTEERLDEIGEDISQLLVATAFFEGELECLQKMAVRASQFSDETRRFESAATAIERAVARGKKIIVFCTYPSTADRLFDFVKDRFGRDVIRYSATESEDLDETADTETTWNGPLTNIEQSILICDRRAEDGLNLQGGSKWVMHFDLPLSPNRVEQRMGRLDRYGSGDPICSIIVTCESNEYESVWCDCLEAGFGVFTESIASLQYLIDAQMKKVRTQLLTDGVDAFREFKKNLAGASGLIASELRRIDDQDGLDALQAESGGEYESLYEVDGDWRNIQSELDGWIEKRLMFEKISSHISEPYPPDKVFRYQYSYTGNKDTLVSLPKFHEYFVRAIDTDAPSSSSKNPRTYPYSFRRQTAVSKGVRLLRIGDDFVNGIAKLTEHDDRGKTFAMWRFVPGYEALEIADVFLKFDFIIESDVSHAAVESARHGYGPAEKACLALSRRADMVFPPIVLTAWLDVELHPVSQQTIDAILDVEYLNRRRDTGWIDFNLNAKRWEHVRKMDLSVLGYWEEFCFKGRKEAEEEIRRRSDLETLVAGCIRRVKMKDEQHYAQLRSRIVRLKGKEAVEEQCRLEAEQGINEALYQGIRQPKIRLDAIGAIFVSGTSLSGVDLEND